MTSTRPARYALLALVCIWITVLAGPAFAQDEPSGGAISGVLTVRSDEGEPEPVEGAEVTVTGPEGEVGTATSDDEGSWLVEVPEAGTYDVSLDPETLPEGVKLRDDDRRTLPDILVEAGQERRVRFLLGERASGGASEIDRFVNLAAQGVKFGSIIALAAVGLSLIFGVTGLVNFAQGELVALGALVAWFLNASDGGPQFHLLLAVAIMLPIAAGVGAAFELGMWRRLRARQTGRISMLVVAIGVSILMRHVFLLLYGGGSRPYTDYTIQRGFAIGPVNLPPKDYVLTVVALVVLVAVGCTLVYTRVGKAMRAVADDRDLAEVSGIDVDRITLITWTAGAALAGLAGVLQGVTEAITWDMGFELLLLMFAAVIVGGLGTAFGAMAGGLMIGVVAQISTYWVSTEFKVVIALAVLVVVLMVRPEGIFGRAERVG
jgi:neutral amino acid transport system permease protein